MRPVNLIPQNERRGDSVPMRTGPLSYLVVGGLLALLIAVGALVLAGNQISERESDLTRLEGEDAALSQQAQELAPYTSFRQLSQARVETVHSLADSRFDWERVMREFSLVLPADVWLIDLNATAAPGVSVEGGEGGASGSSTLRSEISGPALELNGCAAGQQAVAAFVTALKDIDGVTRVGMQSSELGDEKSGAGVEADGEAGGGGGGSEDCRTRNFIAKFSITVGFDAAPAPPSAEGTEVSTGTEEAATEEPAEGTEAEGG